MLQNKKLNCWFGKLKNYNFKNFSHFAFRISHLKNKRGAIGILTSLVLGVVLVMLAVSVVLTGISSRSNTFNLNQSQAVFIGFEGCIESALIRLNRDNAYVGESLIVDGVNCSVSISGIDEERTVTVTGSKNNITRDAVLDVQLSPNFGIIDWNE